MAKKFVRPVNPNKSMVIVGQNINIKGKYPEEVEYTEQVRKAIGEGRLVEIEKDEFDRLKAELAEIRASKAKSTVETPVLLLSDELGAKASELAQKERDLAARELAIANAEDAAKKLAEDAAKKK